MDSFSQRFEIIYKKYAEWGIRNGFKPSKLALTRFLGVTQGAMQKWEKGTIPSGKVLKTIHDKLGFAYDWLICGEGEMFDTSLQELQARDKEIARLKTQIALECQTDEKSVVGTEKAVGHE